MAALSQFNLLFFTISGKTGRGYYEAFQSENENTVIPTFGPYVNLIATYFQIITIISVFDVKTFSYLFSFTSTLGDKLFTCSVGM